MSTHAILHDQLRQRHDRLNSAIAVRGRQPELLELLQRVDAALERMENHSYGLCAVCHDPIEPERLLADPLVEVCLDHLTPSQQKALEADLALAARVQQGLLPPENVTPAGWEVSYHYEALGPVSGDYCDLIESSGADFYFLVGDVSGKGVAASMLMAHLHAMFRTLVSVGLPLDEMMVRASRLFCESTLPMHYATMVVGLARPDGRVEVCNAGHLPLLWLHQGRADFLDSTGFPLGAFCESRFNLERVTLGPGDALVAYTDGLSEAAVEDGPEYGRTRLAQVLSSLPGANPRQLIQACLADWTSRRGRQPKNDDVTLLAIRRTQ